MGVGVAVVVTLADGVGVVMAEPATATRRTVVAAPPAWLDAGTSAEASDLDELTLEVVADGELVADALDADESLAAPPPRRQSTGLPSAALSVKSVETVWEIVPVDALAVR